MWKAVTITCVEQHSDVAHRKTPQDTRKCVLR